MWVTKDQLFKESLDLMISESCLFDKIYDAVSATEELIELVAQLEVMK